ncbi:MAG: hypothetical protein AAFR75_13950 [Pseudomonadota bacterium]
MDKLTVSRRVINVGKRRRNANNTVEYRREKLIANIEEQIELARMSLDREPVQLKSKRGHAIVTVKPRLWWTTEEAGSVLTEIRYNNIPLKITSQGSTIEVGKLARLRGVCQTVIKAVRAGELDQSIQSASWRSHS